MSWARLFLSRVSWYHIVKSSFAVGLSNWLYGRFSNDFSCFTAMSYRLDQFASIRLDFLLYLHATMLPKT